MTELTFLACIPLLQTYHEDFGVIVNYSVFRCVRSCLGQRFAKMELYVLTYR
jgi:hypothetical protein